MPLSARQGFLGSTQNIYSWDNIQGENVKFYLQYAEPTSNLTSITNNITQTYLTALGVADYETFSSVLLADTLTSDAPYGYDQGDTQLESIGGTCCWVGYNDPNFYLGKVTTTNPYAKSSGASGGAHSATCSLGTKDGKVYAFPYDDNKVRIYDPATDTVDVQDWGIDMSGGGTYAVSQALPNGEIYAFGGTADHVLILDTVANTAVTSNLSGVYDTSNTSSKYTTAVLGFDGKIYSPKNQANTTAGWLVIDPTTQTAEIQDWGGVATPSHIAACLGPDGNIWAAPGGTANVWTTIDTSSNTASNVAQTGLFTASGCENTIMGVNGNIYASDTDRIFEFNPNDYTATSLSQVADQTYTSPKIFTTVGNQHNYLNAVGIFFAPGEVSAGGSGGAEIVVPGDLVKLNDRLNDPYDAMALSPYLNKK